MFGSLQVHLNIYSILYCDIGKLVKLIGHIILNILKLLIILRIFKSINLAINGKILQIHSEYSQHTISAELTTDNTSEGW